MWLSLVERCVRDAKAAGSNPVIPTNDNVKPFGIFIPKGFLFTQTFSSCKRYHPTNRKDITQICGKISSSNGAHANH